MPNSQRALLLGWLLALTGAAGAAAIPSLFTDRATWRRLTSTLRRRTWHPTQRDLESDTQLALSRSAALGVTRFALALGALRLSEEIPLGNWATGAAVVVAYLAGVVVQRTSYSRGYSAAAPRLLRGRAPRVDRDRDGGYGCVRRSRRLAMGIRSDRRVVRHRRGRLPDWEMERLGVVCQVAALWVFAAAALPLAWGRRFARRTAPPVAASPDRPAAAPELHRRQPHPPRQTARPGKPA